MTPTWKVLVGDVREHLAGLADDSVQCCVTSPPYWGLRDYGHQGQIGLERSPTEYIAALVAVFDGVRRVLHPTGTVWLNLGDCYANDGKWGGETGGKQAYLPDACRQRVGRSKRLTGLKPKDLVGIPWAVAFALRDVGWWLRRDIVWHKPNPMPESVTDRPASSHEYIFLLAKSERYYYDAEAVQEPYAESTIREARTSYGGTARKQYAAANAQDPSATKARIVEGLRRRRGIVATTGKNLECGDRRRTGVNDWDKREQEPRGGRHCRSVWTINTQPYPDAHFATFPEAIPERCIKAGSRLGDLVLDPFCGSGTTGQVAIQLGRSFIGIELNPAYAALARKRIGNAAPLFAEAAV